MSAHPSLDQLVTKWRESVPAMSLRSQAGQLLRCADELEAALSASFPADPPQNVERCKTLLREIRLDHEERRRNGRCYIDAEFGDMRCERCMDIDALLAALSVPPLPEAKPTQRSCHCPAKHGEDCPLSADECDARFKGTREA